MKTMFKPLLACLITAGALATPQALAADIKPRIIRFGYGLAEDSNQGRAVKLFAASAPPASATTCRCRMR